MLQKSTRRFDPDKLTELRGLKKMSRATLAQLAGLSEVQLKRIENGHSQPRDTSIYRLAEVFGVTADHFFTSVHTEITLPPWAESPNAGSVDGYRLKKSALLLRVEAQMWDELFAQTHLSQDEIQPYLRVKAAVETLLATIDDLARTTAKSGQNTP